MFDKMSKRSYNNTTPTLPEEQYEPITNWMSDLPPLSKKPRAIHPRPGGHTDKHQKQHRPQYQPQHHERHSVEQKNKPIQVPPQPFHESRRRISQRKRFSVKRSKA